MHDLRYALRIFRQHPGFTLVAILTLAIGIGANTALFSVVDCLLVRPMPYRDSDRLTFVWSKPPGDAIFGLSPANFLDYRDQNRVLERMAAGMQADYNVTIRGAAERLSGFKVTAGFLDALGVNPLLGRGFAPGDDSPGAPPVAILGYGAWQGRFGGDRRILGQALTVDGRRATVIGVLPRGFRFAFGPELLMPLAIDPAAAPRDFHALFAFGKIKPGVAPAQARAELEGIASNLARAYPHLLKGWSVRLTPWREWLAGSDRQRTLVLFGAVGFVLLIACANVANLLLAQGAARRRELAVRSALGAGRLRLMRQVLTESILLSAMGGAAGVLLSLWLTGMVSKLISAPILEAIPAISIDGRVLAFTMLLSILTGLLFGAVPAWRASKADLESELKGARGSSSGRPAARFRNALVVAELALSLILLAGAGLMARSMSALYSRDPGFRTDHILTMSLTMPEAQYAEPARVRAFERLLLENVKALPGVRAAALASHMPLQGLAAPMRFQFASHPVANADKPEAAFWSMSDGYFETLGVRLRKGRFFTGRDNESAPRVVIVNETFVKRFLPDKDPLGERLLLSRAPAPDTDWEIAGVVADVKVGSLGNDNAHAQIFAPRAQWTEPGGVLALRTDRDPASLAAAVRAAVRAADRNVPVTDVQTMQQIASASIASSRTQAWTLASFAIAGLILAALGVYGVVAYSTAQRTREMGLRTALGAEPRDLLKMTLRQNAILIGSGLALGLAGSLALTRIIRLLVYAVEPTDPVTYIAVSALLAAVALAAAYIPARRASKADPMAALRWE
ncbi:MAG: ABC transporter permease [Acidobacteriota bacterium]